MTVTWNDPAGQADDVTGAKMMLKGLQVDDPVAPFPPPLPTSSRQLPTDVPMQWNVNISLWEQVPMMCGLTQFPAPS